MPTAVSVLKDLREIFPGQPLSYLKSVAAFYKNDAASLATFVTGVTESRQYPPFPVQRDQELEDFLNKQYQTLSELLPDAEEGYLRSTFEMYAATPGIDTFALDAVVHQNYPKKQKEEFDVALYCELVPDPLASFSHKNYIITENMKADAIEYLVKIFGEKERIKISSTVREEQSLYLSYKKMRQGFGAAGFRFAGVPKIVQPKTFEAPDYGQTFEKIFIQNEAEILSYIENKRLNESRLYALEKSNKSLQECEICCNLRASSKMITICSNNHMMCSTCVKENSELSYYNNILYFSCAYRDCKLFMSTAVIRSVWDTSRFSKLMEDRMSKKEKDGVMCPVCNLQNEKSDKPELICRYCNKKFCVACRKLAHSPQECNKKGSDICKLVEEEMSAALIRYCPNCSNPFIKESGCCNRIRCVNNQCKVCVCYICRKIVSGTDYNHFYGQGVMPSEVPGRCPLYSDINDVHVNNVINSGNKAFKKITSQNPDVELPYNPLDKLPVAGPSDAVPNQY